MRQTATERLRLTMRQTATDSKTETETDTKTKTKKTDSDTDSKTVLRLAFRLTLTLRLLKLINFAPRNKQNRGLATAKISHLLRQRTVAYVSDVCPETVTFC